MGSECRSLAGTTHAASSATERLSLSRIFPAGGHLPSFLPLLEEDPLESRRGGSSFSTGEGIERFSLSASPGIPAAFLREKERKERKKIERSTRRLLHKCIAAIGDIIREARRKVQSNIFVFRCFPFTFEREPLVETRTRPRFPCSRIRESRWRVGGPPRLSTPYYLQTIRRFGLIFGAKVLASPDPRLD